ncbi:MAG: hypothetical protein HY730_03425 [Candidatus Tectomicrobia bacterium]|uniref:Uncharacterized protein n=1 Tax=Tectimicrobiota bacterium TaxID=2528274 RepID=A0A933LQK5_UNCTE|nr:hypothetical protein [Candidatus Tectomicrobia bacterium]
MKRSTSKLQGRKTIGIIQGDYVPQHFIPKVIELYQAGRFPFDLLVKIDDFRNINLAIADAKRGETIKPDLRITILAVVYMIHSSNPSQSSMPF